MIFSVKYESLWITAVFVFIHIRVQVAGELEDQEGAAAQRSRGQLTIRPDEQVNPISYPGCGRPDPTSDNKNAGTRKSLLRAIVPAIVDGGEAKPNAWPWMVALIMKLSEGGPRYFICGGSLISKRYALSAAHCFEEDNNDLAKVRITLGAHTIAGGKEYALERVLQHPDYKPPQAYHDICILKTAQPVVLGKAVKPVCLPSAGVRDQIEGKYREVVVTGWGATFLDDYDVHGLRQATVHIVSQRQCNKTYYRENSTIIPNGITDQMICAGEKGKGKGPCEGDSGGPLVTQLKGGAWVQIGIVGFGIDCQEYAVYTRISQYLQFIFNNTDLGKKLNKY